MRLVFGTLTCEDRWVSYLLLFILAFQNVPLRANRPFLFQSIRRYTRCCSNAPGHWQIRIEARSELLERVVGSCGLFFEIEMFSSSLPRSPPPRSFLPDFSNPNCTEGNCSHTILTVFRVGRGVVEVVTSRVDLSSIWDSKKCGGLP